MSERLERYDVRFVFIADKRRPLEEGKQQPLIFLCAGQAFLHRRVRSIRTREEGTPGGWRGGGVIHRAADTVRRNIHVVFQDKCNITSVSCAFGKLTETRV